MFRALFLIPILCTHALLVGLPFANSCCSEECCNQFAVEVAALYWKTCFDDGVYAITETGAGTPLETFEYHTNVPKHDWGWRIRGGYLFNPCVFLDAEYTSFRQTTKSTATTPTFTVFTAFAFLADSATVDLKTRYQRARGRGGVTLWRGNRSNIYAFGGVSWVHLLTKEDLTVLTSAPGTPQFVLQKSKFDGAGFEAGMGAMFQFLQWAGINVEFNGIGAVGRRNYDLSISTIDPELTVGLEADYPKRHICFPGLDMRAEAFVTFCLGRPFKLAVGYEYHHFFNALLLSPLFAAPASPVALAESQKAQDIGFGGLYVSLGVAF